MEYITIMSRINLAPIYNKITSNFAWLQSAFNVTQSKILQSKNDLAAQIASNHFADVAEHAQTRASVSSKLDDLVVTSSGIDGAATLTHQKIDTVSAAINNSHTALTESVSTNSAQLMSAISNSHTALLTEINKNEQLIRANNVLLAIVNDNQTQYVTYSDTVEFARSASDGNVYSYQNLSVDIAQLIASKSFISSVSVDFVMSSGATLPASDNVNSWLVDGALKVDCRLAPQFGDYTKIIIKYGIVQSESV